MTTDFRKWSPPRLALRLLIILFCCSMLYAGVEVSSSFTSADANLVINGTGFGTELPTVELGDSGGFRGSLKVLKFSPTQIVVAPSTSFICVSGNFEIFINGGEKPASIVALRDFGGYCPVINSSAYNPDTKMVTFTGTKLLPTVEVAPCPLATNP